MSQLPSVLLKGELTGYLRPPQTNGAEHYDVAIRGLMAGRVTRRAAPHNQRPTPGWYVWCAWFSESGSGYILRGEDNNVCYYPTPEDALDALHDTIYPDESKEGDECDRSTTPSR